MTFAVIPAAGKSERMGRPKLALPWAGRTILEHVVSALQHAGIETIVVVIGPHVSKLAQLAESAGAFALQLTEETADMRATVECGLRWLEERWKPSTNADWLLVPADHPTLESGTVQALLKARREHPAAGVIVPTCQGKRGHPTLIAWRHIAGICAMPAGQGLNVYMREQADETVEVAVESPDILWDLDTPGDYEQLIQSEASPRRREAGFTESAKDRENR
jgi:molybdenum cofactor cytidylyltransferase